MSSGNDVSKAMDQGADAAKTNLDSHDNVTESIHGPKGGENSGGLLSNVTSAFKPDGAVGHQFTDQGSVGGAAQQAGGPFDKQGAVGKHFNADGAIGGSVTEAAKKATESAPGNQK